MISEFNQNECFVYITLPGQTMPINETPFHFARRHSLFFSFHSTHPIAQFIVNTVFVSFTCRYDVNRDFPVIYFIDQAVSDRA